MKWKVQYGNRKWEKISLKSEQRRKEFKERRKLERRRRKDINKKEGH